jgi:hypothetical protein
MIMIPIIKLTKKNNFFYVDRGVSKSLKANKANIC